MPLLTRKRQVPVEAEAVEGTAETLVAADVQFFVDETDSSFTAEPQDRDPLRETLSREGIVTGAKMGEISGRTELKQRLSTAPVTQTPPCLDVLLGTGHAQAEVKTAEMASSPTWSDWTPGERITGNAAFVGYFVAGSGTTLTYVLKTGATDLVGAEVLTADDSGETVTVHATTPAATQVGLAYFPSSVNVPSFTVGDYMDGVATTLFGARANGSINCANAGAIPYLAFNWQGTALAPVDAALFTGTSVPNILPETFLSANVRAGGQSLCVDSFNLDFGNTLARRPCANQATGIVSYRITERLPVIAIDPERELEATIPFFTNYAAGTVFGFEATIGQTAGTRTKIVAARCQYTELPQADRDQIATLNAGLRCNAASTAGDDEYFLCMY